jgi:hypothetical protein
MSFQAYIDTIKAKTGKRPEDFLREAKVKGLLEPGVKTSEVLAWLKADYGLQRGHGMALVLTFNRATLPPVTKTDSIARKFNGAKARWRKPFDDLVDGVTAFGPGVALAPTSSYVSLLHRGKKFAIVQVTADRMDVGLKLKGAKPIGRFEPAGRWNSMVTHRVRVSEPRQIDAELMQSLRQAYEEA